MAFVRREGKSWQARYRGPDGKERSKHFKRKVEAENWLTTVQAKKLTGDWIDPKLGKVTFGEWAQEHQEARLNIRLSTQVRDEAYFKNIILPVFADKTLGSITQLEVQRFVQGQIGRYAPATVRKAHQLLSSTLEGAVNAGYIPKNPCRGTPLPKLETREMRFLSPDEISELASAIDPQFRVLVLTAAYTGLRWGELAGLQVSKLHLLKRQLRVEEQLTDVRGNLNLGPVKTKAARRTISLPAFLVER